MNSDSSYSPETPNLGQNRLFFAPCDLEIRRTTLKNNRAPLLCYFKLCASFRNHRRIQTRVTARKLPIWVKIGYFSPCDLENWRMTLKSNRANLLSHFKLSASFHNHRRIQTRVTVRNRPISVTIGYLLRHVTLKFDRWPRKTIGHLSYAKSTFGHHFTTLGEFKLELQSGNPQFG